MRHLHGHRVGSTTPSEAEHRPEGLSVGSLSLQEHRHPPALSLIAIHPGRRIEVIHHHVQITVVVEIAQGQAVANPVEIKPPGSTGIFHDWQAIHARGTTVAEGPQRNGQPREPLTLPEELGIGPQPGPPVGFQLLGNVEVSRTAFLAGGHQQVRKTIQVHIEKRGGP